MVKKRTAIGDIEGGSAPAELKPSDTLTIEHLYQTYRWYPGFQEMHELAVKAIWSNGLTDETIQMDRILEMRDGHEFCYLCGYVAIVVNTHTDPPSVEFMHPEIEGTGFMFKEFSAFGYPTQIEVKMKFAENEAPFRYSIPNYPVEIKNVQVGEDENGDPIIKDYHVREKPILDKGSYGFFIVRNRKGLKGVRGLPAFLPLVHPIRSQTDILNAYVPYAKKQGMGFPAVGLEDNTPTNRATVKREFASQPQTNRLLVMSNKDLVDWIQPTSGAYDPFPILQWIDMLIARKTQMNKLMLEGDPAGYLSASETAISNWEREVKEQQIFWQAQFQPIWRALGASEDCSFQDPAKPAFISLMEGLAKAREALQGIVANEDIVALYNEYLDKHHSSFKLRAISPEELAAMQPQQQDQGEVSNGNTGS